MNLQIIVFLFISGCIVLSSLSGVATQISLIIGMIRVLLDFSLRCPPPSYVNISSIGGCIGYCLYSIYGNGVLSIIIYKAAGLGTIGSKKRNDLTLSDILGCFSVFLLAALTVAFILLSIILTILVHDNPCPPVGQ